MRKIFSGMVFCFSLLISCACFAFDVPDDGYAHSFFTSDGEMGRVRRSGPTTTFELGLDVRGTVRHSLGSEHITLEQDDEVLFGTARTVGNTTYYQFDNGVTGTAHKIGGSIHYDFSDGKSGVLYGF